jgi:hypothetical protein
LDNELKIIINSLMEDRIINFDQIPELELYMDQLTTFFDKKLKTSKRTEEDTLLTKTMINNYTKAKILPVPHKKKYSYDHIMLLTLIYNMKPVISINDISNLLDSTNNDLLKETYNIFTSLQEEEYANMIEDISGKLLTNQKYINSNSKDDEILILVISLIIEASNKKLLAEKIIDLYFSKNKAK